MTRSDDDLIEDAYLKALALDPGNRGARFNLAVHRLHDLPAQDERARHRAELEALVATARRPPAPGLVSEVVTRARDRAAGIRGKEADPFWWHARYAAAAERAHASEKGTPPAEAAEKAADLVRPAVVAGLRVLGRWRWVWTAHARFAADLLPAVAVLFVGTDQERGSVPYVGDEIGRRYRRRVVGRLLLWSDARALRRKLKCGGRDAERLLRLVRSLPESRDARTRYNFACLYAASARDEAEAEAAAELAAAVPALDAEMLRWARRDPSLRKIRPEVERLVGRELKRRAAVAAQDKRAADRNRRLTAARKEKPAT